MITHSIIISIEFIELNSYKNVCMAYNKGSMPYFSSIQLNFLLVTFEVVSCVTSTVS